MIKEYDQLVKLILIGSSGVGKTSILMQFAQNKFSEGYLTTIGVDFRFKTIKHDGRSIKFQIWDTAGQERFRTITSAYYKGADGIIMVYDITEPSSLDDVASFWLPEAHQYCDKNIKILLLGNKSDAERKVSNQKVNNLVDKYSFKHQCVSAKTSDKILDTIRDFGLSAAKEKMEKGGYSSIPQSVAPSSSPMPSTPAVSAPKQVPKTQQQEQKITIGAKAKGVPNYQKKCC